MHVCVRMHVCVCTQLLLATNHYLAVFFVLPSMPTRRTQRLMIVYLVVLSQFAVLVLFFGQEQTGLSILWGILLANGIVVVVKIFSTKCFNSAAFTKAVLFQTLEKVQKQRFRRRRKGCWDLVLRQTVPKGQRAAAKACSLWQGDSLYTLIEPTEAQFCDTQCLHIVPPLYRVKNGKDVQAGAMVCKLVLSQPSGSTMTLEWRQSSAFSAPVVKGFQLMSVRTSDEAVMTSTSNSNDDMANRYYTQMSNVKVAFAGLRQGGSGLLLQGGEPAPSGESEQKRSGHRVQKAHATVRVVRATGLMAADKDGASDPYVTVESLFGGDGSRHRWKQAKTSVKNGTLEPEWDETLELSVFDAEVPLSLAVWDHDRIGKNDFLGASELLLTKCEPGTPTVFTLALSTQGSLEATPLVDRTASAVPQLITLAS